MLSLPGIGSVMVSLAGDLARSSAGISAVTPATGRAPQSLFGGTDWRMIYAPVRLDNQLIRRENVA
jgi:hypothetical protein